ncbi:gasdermin-C-like [Monodelphis domestica]|uniref:gasdermin-C-like n=1 Tax=Monodelphis domestica TaxID=13616 RepID=UPI0024E1D484|nr:gasdermin-C-like [Monodelphis domestica]
MVIDIVEDLQEEANPIQSSLPVQDVNLKLSDDNLHETDLSNTEAGDKGLDQTAKPELPTSDKSLHGIEQNPNSIVIGFSDSDSDTESEGIPEENMSSIFERDAKKLVKELGKGDLIPVQSLLNSTRFRPFCLIRKKEKKFPWFFEPTFLHTYFSLMDILEPSSPVPEVTSSKPLHFYQTEYKELQGERDLNVTSEMQEEVAGASVSSRNLALKLQILTVDPQIWEALMERVKLKVKQLEKKGVIVNQGSILAFRALELFIHNDEWNRLTGKHIYAPTNFEEFQEMMIREQEALLKGSRELRVTLLHVIQDILGNRKALQDLEDMLDQVPDMREKGQLEGPGVCILKHLQDNSGDASNQRTESILYFLRALMILTDTQQELLDQSLEKRILPQQLELVKSILKTNFGQQGESSFSVHPELLSELKDEDQAITMNLMKECGLNLECAGSQTKWNREAESSISALCVVISFLQLLTQA